MTVMTQPFKLWLNKPLGRLGWPFAEDSAMSAYVEPLDTYCNMTHLLPRENWPPQLGVSNIAYFCGVLADEPDDTQPKADGRAKAGAVSYVKSDLPRIWPLAVDQSGGVDRHPPLGPRGRTGPAPLPGPSAPPARPPPLARRVAAPASAESGGGHG